MPNKNYIKGVRMEREVMHYLEKRGWLCFRTAGSHSPIDVIAIRGTQIEFIQCKNYRMGIKAKQALHKRELERFDIYNGLWSEGLILSDNWKVEVSMLLR